MESGDPTKKRCIDDIIEHMTADFEGYAGHYVLLGSPQNSGPPPPAPSQVWSPPQQPLFYQRQPELSMMDVGNGNYVVFSKTNPEFSQHVGFIHYQQQGPAQPPPPPPPIQPQIIDYNQSCGRNFNENINNCCLIENVVGNWVPTRSGTYSPFGGGPPLADEPPPPPIPASPAPVKKRIVAEVKPMRPSYSDVLAKPPLTPPPAVKSAQKILDPVGVKPPKQPEVKKPAKFGLKPNSTLKRQNSSGSEETLADKGGKGPTIRRWSSQEDVSTTTNTKSSTADFKKDKKRGKNIKINKQSEEKPETLYKPVEAFECKTSKSETSAPTVKPPTSKAPKGPKSTVSASKGGKSGARNASKKGTTRSGRRRDGGVNAALKAWKEKSSFYFVLCTTWLIRLLLDVTALSTSLLLHMFREFWDHSLTWATGVQSHVSGFISWPFWPFSKKAKAEPTKPDLKKGDVLGSLSHNISLPTTGEEAMKRLLSCRGKDPYSILGVTSTCSDDDIKKYYRSQALLVHPDKNSQPGAEEAFKILVHAFDLIAEPEKRAAYDRYVAETNQVEQAWSELSDLLSQLHEKMEYAANTIRCNNCGKRHKREMTERPSYAARYCAQCKIHHSAKEGDMWAESRSWWGVRYLACMEGSVYDITQWAHCQGNAIQKVKPDSHAVQYRVLMGRAPQAHPPPEPDLKDLLNSLYSQNGSGRTKKKSKKTK